MTSGGLRTLATGMILAWFACAGALVPVLRGQSEAAQLESPTPATRGAALYADNCSYCHLVDLSGGDLAPALTGPSFAARWTGKPLREVFDYTRTAMPLNSPGGLSLQQNADILAFLLQEAGFAPGPADLPARSEALTEVRVTGGP
jgi:mono/diheme cytochrome c family protein